MHAALSLEPADLVQDPQTTKLVQDPQATCCHIGQQQQQQQGAQAYTPSPCLRSSRDDTPEVRSPGAEPLRMYCWADFLFNFVFLNMFTSGTNNEFETSALLPIPLNWILKVSVVTYSLGPRKNVVLIF